MEHVLLVLLAADPAPRPQPGAFGSMVLPMIIIFFIFYVLMLKPQRKKERERKEMLETLRKGDRVVSVGGLHGALTSVKENEVVMRVDDDKGVKIKINRSAISRVIKEGATADDEN